MASKREKLLEYKKSLEYLITKMDDNNTIELDRNELLQHTMDNELTNAIQTLNFSISANGNIFNATKPGLFPVLINKLFTERVQHKTRKLELESNNGNKDEIAKYSTAEQGIKVFLNSGYGAMANKYFFMYDLNLASSITKSGQVAIRWAEDSIENYFNKNHNIKNILCYNDTDSMYLQLNDLVPKTMENKIDFVDNIAKTEIKPLLDSNYITMAKFFNCPTNKLNFKREYICESAAWKKKKMYVMLVWDSEGTRYPKPIMKVKGLEIVRSSTPAKIRSYLKETVHMLLTEQRATINNRIGQIKKEFDKLTPEQIAFPRSANNQKKWSDSITIYKSRTPIAVKGALIFNRWIKVNNRDITPIYEGDKVKYCYLKCPNPVFNQEVISFINKLPIDRQYVDYPKMFNKSYLSVIYSLCESFNVNLHKKTNLSDIF